MKRHGIRPDGAGADPRNAAALLLWGVVAGPFYLTVGLAQALLREGFDLARHPLSVLARRTWRVDTDRELRADWRDGAC